jgi:hypothetical protein
LSLPVPESIEEGWEVGESRMWAVVRGLPPKFWRRSSMIRSGFPFARNGSLCLENVLDDAFTRSNQNPLEEILGGFLGLFSLGPKASEGRHRQRSVHR